MDRTSPEHCFSLQADSRHLFAQVTAMIEPDDVS